MIDTPLTLPCGATLKNRLVKAAMTERIGDKYGAPVQGHSTLYKTWAHTGAGLLITGNVMVDKSHLESAGNVCLVDQDIIPKLTAWSKAARSNENHVWIQISHAGRQTSKFNARRPLAPSAVPLKRLGLFGDPVPMSEEDIHEVIDGFVRAAAMAKSSGFTGIQIHSAHGYLLSQFLSLRTNKRKDQWGGSVVNRSRLLRMIISKTRESVGPEFPISVKINSSDFQKGGLTEGESLQVIGMLEKLGIDLLEISGGTYENAAFLLNNDSEKKQKESTRRREAYFIEFARKAREVTSVPLMITGGFRSRTFCDEVLERKELDLIGMARPFITNCEDIRGFISGHREQLDDAIIRTGVKLFEDAAEGGYHARQIFRMARGQRYNPHLSALWSASYLILYEFYRSLSRKR